MLEILATQFICHGGEIYQFCHDDAKRLSILVPSTHTSTVSFLNTLNSIKSAKHQFNMFLSVSAWLPLVLLLLLTGSIKKSNKKKTLATCTTFLPPCSHSGSTHNFLCIKNDQHNSITLNLVLDNLTTCMCE